MSFTIKVMPKGWREAEEALRGVKNGFPKAMARAINDGLKAGQTAATKLIRQRYSLKAATLKEQGFMIDKAVAKTGKLEGSFRAKGSMLPVSAFTHKASWKRKEGTNRKYQSVTATIVKGQNKLIKGAFKAKGKLWEREGPGRESRIKVLSTIGTPHMVRSLHIQPQIQKRMEEVSARSLKSNVNYYLAQAAAKTRRAVA
jgi:hypothetical protein